MSPEWRINTETIQVRQVVEIQLILCLKMLVLPMEIERRIGETFTPIGDTLIPVSLVRQNTIHGTVLQGCIGGEDDMR